MEKTCYADSVALETRRHLPLLETHDTQEAFRAKIEKRPPRFAGR